jgi:hypothetical protein
MKTPFCYIGIHNWEYRKERHNVINHPSGRESIRVIVRECKWCGHREHHSLPRVGGKFTLWRNFDDIKKDDSVKFERL